MTTRFVITLACTFGVSLVGTGLMRRYALQKNLVDVPNNRSSHVLATPRGGGVAIVFGFAVGLLACLFAARLDIQRLSGLLTGGVAVAIVGFLDDRLTLPAGVRFTVHLAAALLVVLLIGGIPDSFIARWGLHGFWVGPTLTVVALVWVTNLFNFMDGIDGIAGAEVLFISIAGAWLNWREHGDFLLTEGTLCLAAASAGFLVWNWPPARIFMGDVGSGFIGFTIAGLGLMISQHSAIPIEVWVILGGVFIVDATVTLIRRVYRGDRWFEAHRMHAYQHLARRFGSHRPVTLIVIGINLLWLLPWAIAANQFPSNARIYMAVALLPLVIFTVIAGSGKREE